MESPDEPVIGEPPWQLIFAQVVSPGAPVYPAGGRAALFHASWMQKKEIARITAVKSKDLLTIMDGLQVMCAEKFIKCSYKNTVFGALIEHLS